LSIGEKHVAAALSDWVAPVPDDVAKTLDALSNDDPHDTPAMAAVREAYRANSETTPVFGKVVEVAAPGAQTTGSGNAQTLAGDLELVATCVKAGVPSHVYRAVSRIPCSLTYTWCRWMISTPTPMNEGHTGRC
jgi:hypothetical protein